MASVDDLWKQTRKKKAKRNATYSLGRRVPANVVAPLSKAQSHYVMGDYKEAVDLLTECIKLSPQIPIPYYTLGLIYEEKLDYITALQFYVLAANYSSKTVHLWQKVLKLGKLTQSCSEMLLALRSLLKLVSHVSGNSRYFSYQIMYFQLLVKTNDICISPFESVGTMKTANKLLKSIIVAGNEKHRVNFPVSSVSVPNTSPSYILNDINEWYYLANACYCSGKYSHSSCCSYYVDYSVTAYLNYLYSLIKLVDSQLFSIRMEKYRSRSNNKQSNNMDGGSSGDSVEDSESALRMPFGHLHRYKLYNFLENVYSGSGGLVDDIDTRAYNSQLSLSEEEEEEENVEFDVSPVLSRVDFLRIYDSVTKVVDLLLERCVVRQDCVDVGKDSDNIGETEEDDCEEGSNKVSWSVEEDAYFIVSLAMEFVMCYSSNGKARRENINPETAIVPLPMELTLLYAVCQFRLASTLEANVVMCNTNDRDKKSHESVLNAAIVFCRKSLLTILSGGGKSNSVYPLHDALLELYDVTNGYNTIEGRDHTRNQNIEDGDVSMQYEEEGYIQAQIEEGDPAEYLMDEDYNEEIYHNNRKRTRKSDYNVNSDEEEEEDGEEVTTNTCDDDFGVDLDDECEESAALLGVYSGNLYTPSQDFHIVGQSAVFDEDGDSANLRNISKNNNFHSDSSIFFVLKQWLRLAEEFALLGMKSQCVRIISSCFDGEANKDEVLGHVDKNNTLSSFDVVMSTLSLKQTAHLWKHIAEIYELCNSFGDSFKTTSDSKQSGTAIHKEASSKSVRASNNFQDYSLQAYLKALRFLDELQQQEEDKYDQLGVSNRPNNVDDAYNTASSVNLSTLTMNSSTNFGEASYCTFRFVQLCRCSSNSGLTCIADDMLKLHILRIKTILYRQLLSGGNCSEHENADSVGDMDIMLNHIAANVWVNTATPLQFYQILKCVMQYAIHQRVNVDKSHDGTETSKLNNLVNYCAIIIPFIDAWMRSYHCTSVIASASTTMMISQATTPPSNGGNNAYSVSFSITKCHIHGEIWSPDRVTSSVLLGPGVSIAVPSIGNSASIPSNSPLSSRNADVVSLFSVDGITPIPVDTLKTIYRHYYHGIDAFWGLRHRLSENKIGRDTNEVTGGLSDNQLSSIIANFASFYPFVSCICEFFELEEVFNDNVSCDNKDHEGQGYPANKGCGSISFLFKQLKQLICCLKEIISILEELEESQMTEEDGEEEEGFVSYDDADSRNKRFKSSCIHNCETFKAKMVQLLDCYVEFKQDLHFSQLIDEEEGLQDRESHQDNGDNMRNIAASSTTTYEWQKYQHIRSIYSRSTLIVSRSKYRKRNLTSSQQLPDGLGTNGRFSNRRSLASQASEGRRKPTLPSSGNGSSTLLTTKHKMLKEILFSWYTSDSSNITHNIIPIHIIFAYLSRGGDSINIDYGNTLFEKYVERVLKDIEDVDAINVVCHLLLRTIHYPLSSQDLALEDKNESIMEPQQYSIVGTFTSAMSTTGGSEILIPYQYLARNVRDTVVTNLLASYDCLYGKYFMKKRYVDAFDHCVQALVLDFTKANSASCCLNTTTPSILLGGKSSSSTAVAVNSSTQTLMQPLPWLCLCVNHLLIATRRNNSNKSSNSVNNQIQVLFTNAMSCFAQYSQSRKYHALSYINYAYRQNESSWIDYCAQYKVKIQQEVLFNLGRIYTEMVLYGYAVTCYRSALEAFDTYCETKINIKNEGNITLQLFTQEIAHNLVLIYKRSGNDQLAREIMLKYLVF